MAEASKITLLCPDARAIAATESKERSISQNCLEWFASMMVTVRQELESLSVD